MCCLFGLVDYQQRLTSSQRLQILEPLSAACEARGTDATGIAYNAGGSLHIYKRPWPAHRLRFHLPDDASVIMGHTRMTTQGSARRNRNNHPFRGFTAGTQFALAHNGVLYNDRKLRKTQKLPRTRIETDSYVAVQLLEAQNALTPDSLREMAESVEGSFVFTVLSQHNDLYLVRGENPLCLFHYPRLGLYLYASTREILERGLQATWLSGEAAEHIPVDEGELLHLDAAGRLFRHSFAWRSTAPFFWRKCSGFASCSVKALDSDPYIRDLKSVAGAYGYTSDEIDTLLMEGFSPEEIEEMFYYGEA